ncbi:MAG: beta-lactamase family protein [Parvularculaceae bacterium]|nr:beta-lactamase family protein [Parvularculaceae bacterium]
MSSRFFLRTLIGAIAGLACYSASAQEIAPAQDVPESMASPVSQVSADLAGGETPGSPALTREDVDAWLDGFMPYAIAQGDIVGAQVTVVKDGEILTSRGFGYADLENGVPVDGYKTLFRPGSISKLFTWIAVMQQVEQGRIDLDEDVNAYLDFKIPDAFGAPVTMRNIMTHTAGFQEKFKNLLVGSPELLTSLEDSLKSSPPPLRIYPPGETPAYSNYASALAGYIVQRVSGELFEAYVEKHIFQPLNMDNATFVQPLPAKFEHHMSKGYKAASDGKAQYYELIAMSPAGALAADGESMGRFMIGLLAENPAVLKPETWERMYNTIDDLTPPLNAMALGFWELDKGDLTVRGHAGDTNFFHSDLNVIPEKNAGIYVTVNSMGKTGGTLRFAVTSGFEERYFPEASVAVGPRLNTAKEHGAMLEGVYESSRTITTTFAAVVRYLSQSKIAMNEDGDLVYDLLGTPAVWREVEPFVWRHTAGYERLAAKLNDAGEVEYVTFEPVSPAMLLLPAPMSRNSVVWTPMLAGALFALLATLITWPVRAIVRSRYKTRFAVAGREAAAYRFVRIGIVLVFAFLIAWALVLQQLFANLTGLTDAFTLQLRVTQSTQVLLYLAAAVAAWNVSVVWRSGQSLFAKLWSLVIFLALVVIVLFSGLNGLLSWGTNF